MTEQTNETYNENPKKIQLAPICKLVNNFPASRLKANPPTNNGTY